MAKVAGGLKGKAAVTAISTRFERPANPAAEIADAMAHYGKNGSLAGMVGKGQGFGGGAGVAKGGGVAFDAVTYRKQASALLMQQAMAQANGGNDPSTGQPPPNLVSSLEMARQAATVKITSGGPGVLGKGGTKINLGNGVGAQAAKMALKQVGQPYVWGGEKAGKGGGFDCSGLVQWAYGALGIKLPRVAADQGKMGKAVRYTGGGGNLKAGDLLVENNGDHIVMYIGNGKVVQAPHTGTNVQVSPLSWFPASQYNARRIAG